MEQKQAPRGHCFGCLPRCFFPRRETPRCSRMISSRHGWPCTACFVVFSQSYESLYDGLYEPPSCTKVWITTRSARCSPSRSPPAPTSQQRCGRRGCCAGRGRPRGLAPGGGGSHGCGGTEERRSRPETRARQGRWLSKKMDGAKSSALRDSAQQVLPEEQVTEGARKQGPAAQAAAEGTPEETDNAREEVLWEVKRTKAGAHLASGEQQSRLCQQKLHTLLQRRQREPLRRTGPMLKLLAPLLREPACRRGSRGWPGR